MMLKRRSIQENEGVAAMESTKLRSSHDISKLTLQSENEAADMTTRVFVWYARVPPSLYRDIIRATQFFVWPDSRGVLWRDVLRENARKEFEAARFEKDPEVITKLLIGGRDAVQAALDKLVEKQKQQIQNERNQSHRR